MGCRQCLEALRGTLAWIASDDSEHASTYEFYEELGGVSWIARQLGIPELMVQPVYSQKLGKEVLTGFSVWVPIDALESDS